MFDRLKPYNDVPPLPPDERVTTERVLMATVDAARELAELKGMGNLIPRQDVLIHAISLQEAKLSSEIENVYTTHESIYVSLSGSTKDDPATKEVMRYSNAVQLGIEQIRSGSQLDSKLLTEIAGLVKGERLGVRDTSGAVIANTITREVVYTPPVGAGLIEGLLDNISDYLVMEDGVDPLIKMCVSHYQFEAIHPFRDGNGRTGRIANMVYLVQKGLLDEPVIFPSRYILENRLEYQRGLRRVTEERAWEDWIVFMLRGLQNSALHAKHMVVAIDKELKSARDVAKTALGRKYSSDLIDLVFSMPYIRIKNVMDAGFAKRDTASLYLSLLEKAGLLSSEVNGRDKYYINRPLMKILTE